MSYFLFFFLYPTFWFKNILAPRKCFHQHNRTFQHHNQAERDVWACRNAWSQLLGESVGLTIFSKQMVHPLRASQWGAPKQNKIKEEGWTIQRCKTSTLFAVHMVAACSSDGLRHEWSWNLTNKLEEWKAEWSNCRVSWQTNFVLVARQRHLVREPAIPSLSQGVQGLVVKVATIPVSRNDTFFLLGAWSHFICFPCSCWASVARLTSPCVERILCCALLQIFCFLLL